MIKALGEPGLCGRHLASWPARPGLVSRQKWGCGDQRGRVTGAPDPPAGLNPLQWPWGLQEPSVGSL